MCCGRTGASEVSPGASESIVAAESWWSPFRTTPPSTSRRLSFELTFASSEFGHLAPGRGSSTRPAPPLQLGESIDGV